MQNSFPVQFPKAFPAKMPVRVGYFNDANYDRYVSPDGNDANSGKSPTAPWLTMTRLQAFVDGTVLSVGVTLSATSGTVTATLASGTWDAGDVGKSLAGNSSVTGTGVITSVSGAVATVAVVVAFSSTNLTNGLSRLAEMADGKSVKVLVQSGTYLNQNFQPNRVFYVGTNATHLTVYFGPGTIWQRTVTDNLSAFEGRGANWVLEGIGDAVSKLRITGWSTGDGNGVGAFSAMLVIVRNMVIDGCVDGLSAHNTATIRAYDCEVSDCNKAAFTHVDSSSCEHYRCTFTGRAAASQGLAFGVTVVNERCVFIPATAGQTVVMAGGSSFRCKFGTVAMRVGLTLSSSVRHTLTKCFVHCVQGVENVSRYYYCYGLYSKKLIGLVGAEDTTWSHCIFKDAPVGATYDRFLFAEAQEGAEYVGNPHIVEDTIITGYAVAIGGSFTATSKATFGVSSFLRNLCMFNNTTNITASIASSDIITTDPLLGPCDSTDIEDWCVADNSPCVGAGVGGGNIGFTLADISDE